LYRNERYPTRDRVIPWRLFQVLITARRHVMAEERLNAAHSTGLAIARAMGSDKVEAAGRAEEREAYPGG
jgi:hypothetical protein